MEPMGDPLVGSPIPLLTFWKDRGFSRPAGRDQEGFALWTPTAFEKAGETFNLLCAASPCIRAKTRNVSVAI